MLFILSLLVLIVTMLLILCRELPVQQFKLAHIPLTLCLGACVYVLMLFGGIGDSGTFSREHPEWTRWILLVGALSGLALLLPRLITTGRALLADDGIDSPLPRITFSLGLWILGSAAAVYLAWIALAR